MLRLAAWIIYSRIRNLFSQVLGVLVIDKVFFHLPLGCENPLLQGRFLSQRQHASGQHVWWGGVLVQPSYSSTGQLCGTIPTSDLSMEAAEVFFFFLKPYFTPIQSLPFLHSLHRNLLLGFSFPENPIFDIIPVLFFFNKWCRSTCTSVSKRTKTNHDLNLTPYKKWAQPR